MKYWINMKTSHKRLSQPFKAVLGFDPAGLLQSAIDGANCMTLNIGWLTLYFGRDGNWNEFLVAMTDRDCFYLGVEPLPVTADAGWESGFPWVYAMKHHPNELFVGYKPPTVLKYVGITVVHAMDQRRRNFLTVAMPGDKLHLVFRNPGSRATADWRPCKQPIAITGAVLPLLLAEAKAAMQVAAPTQSPTVNADTGDSELDELLSGLDR